MDKLKMHSPNLVDSNIEKISVLFPNCITETKDENGELKKAIDFDLLKQELSQVLVEGEQERYRLDWVGKKEAILAANAPIAKTLRPCREESVNFDKTENLFIEGDNLEALKLLQENYLGKVKMIYIDPPYNTGNDFIYEDDFAENTDEFLQRSSQIDEEGNRLIANTESNGRFHSDWLTMMYSRLKLSRNLLNDEGVLFISIDNNEQHNLIKICNEIYGEKNYIGTIAVQLNPRGRNLDKFIATTHESLIIIAKNSENLNALNGLPKEGRMIDEYNLTDPQKGKYRLLGLRNRNQSFNPITRPNLYFPLFVDPLTKKVSPDQNDIYTDIVYPDTPEGVKTCWTWGKDKIIKENELLCAEKTGSEWRIYRKDFLIKSDGEIATTLPKSIWIDAELNNDYGKRAIKELFDKNIMDFPKSPELIKKIISIGLNKDDIILDFFAGSSTSAHAVMQLNADDVGNRKFIMVQLPEQTDEKKEAFKAGYKTIAEISKERIRRAGKKILEDNATKEGIENLDIGFRVLKIDSTNMKDVYYTPDALKQADMLDLATNIKEDRTSEDLLFQVMLDWGLELSLSIERKTVAGKEVFFVAGNSLVACFDELTFDVVDEVAKEQPLRFVSAEKSIHLDHDKTNIKERFKQLSPDTEVKFL
ncbi:site-specific DNA-methyltransferase [Acinetobacter baumannii]|uniref:site-specific DNA-methyltransferase n=1 Tax=Acinetobacter baumannii TaxID=470 RepID=UPI0038923F91